MSADHPIIIAGDPHVNHKPSIRARLDNKPGTLILLGDVGLERPLREAYAEVPKVHWKLRYIHGNQDVDSHALHDNFLEDAPGWCIHAGFVEADGLLIGGLGGVQAGLVSPWR